MDFHSFGFDDRILRALDETGHHTPTPIQEQAIPVLLEGKDLLAIAQTGTGKTAAFALPAIQLLSEKPIKVGPQEVRALILAPTRELAEQISKNLKIYARHFRMKQTVVYGGTPYRPQIQAMRKGVDILVATPGRLIDLLESGHINLAYLEQLILDEADRMLDMGFIHDIRKLIEFMPEDRQALMLSATMPPKVEELGRSLLQNPSRIEISPESTPVDRIDQRVMFVDARNKQTLLGKLFKDDESMERVIIFTKTKWKADKIAKHLEMTGHPAESIHGDKTQAKRQRVLNAFQKGKIKVLVATDVAARGIDVSNITHVINYELPMEAESYIHRIGRTARAGTTGTAIAFCDKSERGMLNGIERIMDMDLPVDDSHPFHDEQAAKKTRSRRNEGPRKKASQNRNKPRAVAKEDPRKAAKAVEEKSAAPQNLEEEFGSVPSGKPKTRKNAKSRGIKKERWGKDKREERDRKSEAKSRRDKEKRQELADQETARDFKPSRNVERDSFDRPSRDDRKSNDRKNDKRIFARKDRDLNREDRAADQKGRRGGKSERHARSDGDFKEFKPRRQDTDTRDERDFKPNKGKKSFGKKPAGKPVRGKKHAADKRGGSGGNRSPKGDGSQPMRRRSAK